MKITAFKTDLKKETGGVWLPGGAGLELLVARWNNSIFEEEIARLQEEMGARFVIAGSPDVEQNREIIRRAAAKTILLGWKNLEEEDGSPIEYSVEKAYQLMTDMPEFYRLVVQLANNINNFRVDKVNRLAGNSSATSAG
jgi:hypothetical protein